MKLTRPNFFCDKDSMTYLVTKRFEGDYEYRNLSIDLIEMPYYLLYDQNDEAEQVEVFLRGEIYTHDDSGTSVGIAKYDKKTNSSTSGSIEQISEDLLGLFAVLGHNLSCFIQEERVDSFYEGFDPENEGIQLYMENEELKYKAVAGKDRPEMMCTTLFDGIKMCRPYMDETLERSLFDFMSLEDKIEAAEDGNEVCMADLAMLYTNGDDETQQDPRKAVYWLQKLADAGNAVGMFNLGLYCAKGFGTERDLEKAAFWMEKAAQAGDEDAPAVARQYRKMCADLEKAVTGDAQAQADLAVEYMRLGNSLDPAGPGKDYEDGLFWARKAEAQDCPDAMWVLALAYQHGRGVEPDAEKAVSYYEKGAALGNAACRHSLGCEYMTGTHLKRDKKKGFELFLQSAEQGYGLAMRDVGYCYQMGDGCTGNLKKAAEWYEKALEKIDEPEVEQRLALIRMISEHDEDWDNDYDEMPGPDEEEDEDTEVYCGFCGKGPLTDEQKKQFESWDGFYCSQECLDKQAEAFHREVFGDLFESFEAGKTPEEIAAEKGADLAAIKKILGLE